MNRCLWYPLNTGNTSSSTDSLAPTTFILFLVVPRILMVMSDLAFLYLALESSLLDLLKVVLARPPFSKNSVLLTMEASVVLKSPSQVETLECLYISERIAPPLKEVYFFSSLP